MYKRLPGEEEIIGPHVFSNEVSILTPNSNRELLVEMSAASDLTVANAFFEDTVGRLATCQNVGQQRQAGVTWEDTFTNRFCTLSFSMALRRAESIHRHADPTGLTPLPFIR